MDIGVGVIDLPMLPAVHVIELVAQHNNNYHCFLCCLLAIYPHHCHYDFARSLGLRMAMEKTYD